MHFGTYEPASPLVRGLKAIADPHLEALFNGGGLPGILRPARGFLVAKYDEMVRAMDANPEATGTALREQLAIVCAAAGITGADLDAARAAVGDGSAVEVGR